MATDLIGFRRVLLSAGFPDSQQKTELYTQSKDFWGSNRFTTVFIWSFRFDFHFRDLVFFSYTSVLLEKHEKRNPPGKKKKRKEKKPPIPKTYVSIDKCPTKGQKTTSQFGFGSTQNQIVHRIKADPRYKECVELKSYHRSTIQV